MSSPSVDQGQCTSDDLDCPCCDHTYDAGRTRATITLLKRVRLPHDWSVTEARKNPLSQRWHIDHFLPLREQIRGLTESEAENYPLRQAALVAAVLEHAPWADRTRYGAAWGLIRVGMKYHGWVAASAAEAERLLAPEPDYFVRHSGMMDLSGVITRAYVHSGGETVAATVDLLIGH